MKQVTASEARKNWFRLLDEALDGEVIAVQR
jgi:antitoxin (DNA-binding transcriptional repressor) of toxin-antitoxin stability system